MIGGGRPPSAALPLRYVLTAVGAFVLATLGVPLLAERLAGFYYQPPVVALAHTVTLGWITLTIMGASFQLVPIILERRLWSERLAALQFWLTSAGIVGMVGHFWIARWNGLAWAAGVLGLGVVCYLVNIALSLRPLPRPTATARLFLLGLAGLSTTLLFGFLLALDRNRPFLPGPFFGTLLAHFHLALLGWVAPMILGVAARVLPMFLQAPEPGGWGLRLQVWGVTVGAPAVTLALLAESRWLPATALVAGAAGGAFVLETARMVRGRRRRLDWGLRFILTGTAFLLPAGALGLGFAFGWLWSPTLAAAYAVLLLGGWVSLTIVGMLLKIVPFLVWYRTFAPRAGREPVPSVPELSRPALEGASFWLLSLGVLGLATAMAAGSVGGIRMAGVLLAAGALTFASALGRILRHLARAGSAGYLAGLAA